MSRGAIWTAFGGCIGGRLRTYSYLGVFCYRLLLESPLIIVTSAILILDEFAVTLFSTVLMNTYRLNLRRYGRAHSSSRVRVRHETGTYEVCQFHRTKFLALKYIIIGVQNGHVRDSTLNGMLKVGWARTGLALTRLEHNRKSTAATVHKHDDNDNAAF
jgi:hypothetical protein